MSGHDCPVCGESFPSSSCALGGSVGHDCHPLTGPDRRDRDELTDRDDLAELVNGRPLPPDDRSTIGGIFERATAYERADALIAAGWVHWPHDCKREAEQNEKWQRSEGYDEGYAVGYRAGRNDRTDPET